MAIVETSYDTVSAAAAILRLKIDHVAQGAAVVISSDGSTYAGAGDQITHAGSGAGGLDNSSAYFVLRRTGVPDFLFQRGASSQYWDVLWSVTGAFAGGDATSRPTAVDERLVIDSNTMGLFSNTTLDTVVIVIEDAAPGRWAMHVQQGSDDFHYSEVGSADHPIMIYNQGFSGGVFFSESDATAWTDIVSMLNVSSGTPGDGGTDPVPPTRTGDTHDMTRYRKVYPITRQRPRS